MFNLLLEGISPESWILPGILFIFLIGMVVLNIFRQKKQNEMMTKLATSLKAGDKVKTYSGLYGEIVEIIATEAGKIAVLKTGSENNPGYFSIDINAIYGVEQPKENLVIEEDANKENISEEVKNDIPTEVASEEISPAAEIKKEAKSPSKSYKNTVSKTKSKKS